ncbi:E3 SUMO-protein ligase SIZ1 isoform X2 [Eutrema salsugineum]|uniref:E3 SUMO-protein ligase SIZ1 isoform X2 n=1 Tax=Eutrema salsugineum TaxID=72664 RepID=UPI000CED1111|nr:E3 SUMO-protein ligase SIZ1 isoform X2 [Eutrema salsugineum]XP_024011479.1 E3 SUMO-protein ligase SIZ1 isoform X2 [Eutrema salsugineum]XP_024011480.1 E3 SUMO-protein ligase SIZ1 isoform X2 [Eutrema salsugineum]XP_024011481.1 E3 SUMO-protein ligase SIZ1 isoform X2 [Eutrema salsugineum]
MDLEASCKDKLSHFRIKELKDVLTQLGLSKQGKKQELVDRILTLLSDERAARLWSKKNTVAREEVAKLVDDTYRKMQVSGASDLASKGQVSSDTSNLRVKGEPEDPFQPEMKVRCVCGSSLETDSMIQCEDPRCHVWEHVGCVIVPEKPMDGNPPLPESFYCEICRLTRADPFWVTVAHPLYPLRLTATTIPTDGTNTMQSVERTFQITRADKELLAKQEYDVQAWCMLLNDKVLFRMQWPQYADLQINGMPVRAINRPGSQLLGANGRDDGPIITPCIRDGINRISLSGGDNRSFCFGVRLVKRRTLQQVLNLIPEETKGETFEDALARVRRCIGGGGGDDNADSDSDIEVVADFFGVNLRCPMSGSRIKVAGRFLPCVHMGCFDLEVFVELNQRSRKWQCPICLKNYSVEHVIVDPYFNRITTKMKHCDEEVTEIEVKPDGSWRVKSKKESERRELGELSQWHAPDGSLCPSADEIKRKMEMLIPVKQEGFSDGPTPLKLGIRKNRNGLWEVSKPNTNGLSSSNRQEKVGYQDKNIIPMSSSATGSGRDGDDVSVNQDAIGTFDFGTNGIELDSISMNVDSGYNFPDRNQAGEDRNNEVIVLSDSDEENDVVITPGPAYSGCRTDGGVNFPLNPPGIINSYNEDPNTIAGGSSRLGLFSDDDEFDTPLWTFPSETPEAPGFQLFASDADVSEGLVGLHHHGSLNCGPEINGGYTMAPETSMASITVVPCSDGRSESVANDGLVDNPLAFGRDDPSLQIFLPTKPDASAQSGFKNQADMSNGIRSDDWISLRLGDSACGNHGEPATANGLNSSQQMSTREGSLDTTTETASLLLGMNDSRQDKAKKQRSDNPFSFPRQKRSNNQQDHQTAYRS